MAVDPPPLAKNLPPTLPEALTAAAAAPAAAAAAAALEGPGCGAPGPAANRGVLLMLTLLWVSRSLHIWRSDFVELIGALPRGP